LRRRKRAWSIDGLQSFLPAAPFLAPEIDHEVIDVHGGHARRREEAVEKDDAPDGNDQPGTAVFSGPTTV
jgi:hypothetical protein